MPTVLGALWQDMPRVYLASTQWDYQFQFAESMLFPFHCTKNKENKWKYSSQHIDAVRFFFLFIIFFASRKTKNMPSSLLSPLMLLVSNVFSFGMCAEVCGRRHLLIMHVLLLSGEYPSQITEMLLAWAVQEQKKTLLYPSAALNLSINSSKGNHGHVWAGIRAIFKTNHFLQTI